MAPEPKTAKTAKQTMKLPVLAAGPVDIGRLVRELELIDDSLLQLKLRKGNDAVRLPKTSQLMDQAVQLNKLNLLHVADRQKLSVFLTETAAKAPVLHISFSADPSVAFMEKLVAWLRREVHPNVMVTIGLQPNIGAGCMVRSTNRYFDFTLRQKFAGHRDLLLEKLVEGTASGAKV